MYFRAAEDFEYSELLDAAAKCNDIAEQLAYVAAFTVSAYSTSSERLAKPFNPMLGETYECDRTDDMEWRSISEQVSHHPPIQAKFCESKHGWKCSQDFQLATKFRGKHVTVIPAIFSRVEFTTTGTSFTFNRPHTSVYNLIFGKMYCEHFGEVKITGEVKAQGWKCILNYQPNKIFTKDQRLVKGVVLDPTGNIKLTLSARWDDKMEMSKYQGKHNDDGPPKVIWRKRPPPTDSYLYYNFTTFAVHLNEMEDGVAPTDSRHRPDQRLMENGDWDEANRVKVQLEEKQRERRRLNQDVKPLWFARRKDELTGNFVYKYAENYWECKNTQSWSKCPSIF